MIYLGKIKFDINVPGSGWQQRHFRGGTALYSEVIEDFLPVFAFGSVPSTHATTIFLGQGSDHLSQTHTS